MIADEPRVRLVNTSQPILHVFTRRYLQDMNNLVQVGRTCVDRLQAHELPYSESESGSWFRLPEHGRAIFESCGSPEASRTFLPTETAVLAVQPSPEMVHAARAVGVASTTLRGLAMGIARGFMASGTTRKRPTLRSPFSRLASVTPTWSASWKLRTKALAAMP